MTGRLATWWLRAEPHVMGRAAVAVVIACLQVPAIAQLLTPVTASQTINEAGPSALAYVWAASIVLAGALLIASHVTSDPEAERVLEVASLSLVTVVCCVYVVAIVETVGVVGALFLLATLLALIVNNLGRAVLLTRQVLAARRLAKAAREGRL